MQKIPTETTIHSSPLVLFAPMENPATSDQDRVLRAHLEVTQPNRVQTVSNARLGNTLMILKVRIPRHWFVKIVLYRLLQVLEILNAQIVQTGKKLLSKERPPAPLVLSTNTEITNKITKFVKIVLLEHFRFHHLVTQLLDAIRVPP